MPLLLILLFVILLNRHSSRGKGEHFALEVILLYTPRLYLMVITALACLCGIQYYPKLISLHNLHCLLLPDLILMLHVTYGSNVVRCVVRLILESVGWKWGADLFENLYFLNYIIATSIKPQVSCIPL